jgi:hypothetical protein
MTKGARQGLILTQCRNVAGRLVKFNELRSMVEGKPVRVPAGRG